MQNGTSIGYNLEYDQAGQLITAQAGSGSFASPPATDYRYAYDTKANRTSIQSATIETVRVGDTKTTGDTLTVTVKDPLLSGGQKSINYTVQASDNLQSIALGLATNINLDPD